LPVYKISDSLTFPNPNQADESGLLAFGGDLSPDRILLAYKSSIFTWYSSGDPILWWSPPQRMILYPNSLRINKSLKRAINSGEFEIRVDENFDSVIEACSQIPRKDQNGTWINTEMQTAYKNLHQLGYAHSFETWKDNELVGGLYGLSLGRAFFGESMFSRHSESSKFAFYHLHEFAIKHEFHFIDCQLYTEHLASMGATEIEREEYLSQLEKALIMNGSLKNWTI